jgi:hypothetical protein
LAFPRDFRFARGEMIGGDTQKMTSHSRVRAVAQQERQEKG